MGTTIRDGATDLYRYFDADDRLLYVGISFSAVARAAQHRQDKGWWTEFATMTVERFDTRREAAAAELEAIRTERPRHNVAGVAMHHNSRIRRYAIGASHIVVTEARLRRAVWGGTELVVTNCPECGETHRHGVLDIEIQRGVAYRYPHCHYSTFKDITPWQILRFRSRNMNLDPSISEDEDYTRTGSTRMWSHHQFRRWAERCAELVAA